MYIQKLLNKTCMLFSCSSVLCLILRLSQRPKRTEERFRFKCEDNPEEAAGTQMWTNEVHGEGPGEGRLRGQIFMFIEQPSKSLGFLLPGLEINIRHSSFSPEASCLPGNRAHHLLRPLTGKQHPEVFTQKGDSLQDFKKST